VTPPAGPSKVIPGPWRPSGGEPPRETLEVRADRLVQDWSSARGRAQGYLEALGFDDATRTELARRAVEAAVARPAWNTGDAVSETMGALRDILYGPESAQMDGAEPGSVAFFSQAAAASGLARELGLAKPLVPVQGTRTVNKTSMIHNSATPNVEVDPETYVVRIDGELITCEPADVLPMAQRYFLY
jgi:hypothetical protein